MICDIGDLRPATPTRISAANVGDDPDEAIAAREQTQAHFEVLETTVPVVQLITNDASPTCTRFHRS
jgi:hypothetical protein